MKPKSSPLILLTILAAVILVSGCTGLDPTALAKSNSMIQQFLDDHPNAQIKVTHFTAEQAKNMIGQIRSDCDNPYLDEKEFYRVNITDTDTNFFAVVWIDWANRSIECVYKIGTEGKTIEKPREAECESHGSYKCDSGNLYWFDSCGNKQDKKEYCQYGCLDQKCLGNCTSHAEYRCYGDHVYWFDSCGNKQEKKEYCNYGCENGFCKAKPAEKTCEEAGGYCIWPATATSAGGGGSGAATGMLIVTAVTTTTTQQVVYQCQEGYTMGSYFCKEGGICCIPKAYQPPTGFCGNYTQGLCLSDSDCTTGGCSGQVCQSVHEEPVITTCEYRDCYNAEKYGVACKCVKPTSQVTGAMTGADSTAGRCMWTRTACTEEAKVCPDGTTVGRTGPNCEFAPCPAKCGNSICESGEADYCPPCYNETPPCLAPCTAGTCPKDCQAICKDSDGGNNYYQQGTATASGQSLTDHCNSDGTLTEKYCVNGQITTEIYQCQYNCSNGACLNTTVCTQDVKTCPDGSYVSRIPPSCEFAPCPVVSVTCTDTDGGSNYYTKGTVSYSGGSYNDFCSSSAKLTEYSCSVSGTPATSNYTCPNGCSNGACVQQTTTSGGVCVGNKENGCCIQGGACDKKPFNCIQGQEQIHIGCEYPSCKEVVQCVDKPQQCTDSDGGENFYSQGSCNEITGYTYNDTCYVPYPTLTPPLTEYYCGSDGYCHSQEVSCQSFGKRCVAGRCTSETCIDTDGGIDIYKKASVGFSSSNGWAEAQDLCYSSSVLREFYCSQDNMSISNTLYTCPSGVCYNGACIQ